MFKAQDIRRLNAIFRDLATRPNSGRGEFQGGCPTRAAQARAALAQEGYRVGSCVLRGRLAPTTGSGAPLLGCESVVGADEAPYSTWRPVRWGRHVVGVALPENRAGQEEAVVFDTVVCDGPMRLTEYLRLYGPNVTYDLVTCPEAHRLAAMRVAAAKEDVSKGRYARVEPTDEEALIGEVPNGQDFAERRGFRTLGTTMGYGNYRVLPLAHMPGRAVDKVLLPVMAYKT